MGGFADYQAYDAIGLAGLVRKREAGLQPLAEVSEAIRQRLQRAQATSRVAELVAEARARYNLVLAERNLPFALHRPE